MRATIRTLRRSLGLAVLVLLASAPAALAADGEGLMGRVTDKQITFFCFGVIALFMVLPIVLSLLQHRLDTRKERMREQLERVSKT
jgi:preprotein translocase subunit SecG